MSLCCNVRCLSGALLRGSLPTTSRPAGRKRRSCRLAGRKGSAVAYSALASRLLSGHHSAETVFPAQDWCASDARFSGQGLRERLALARHMREIAKRWRRSLARVAITWVLASSAAASAIAGMHRPDHVTDALRAAAEHLDQAAREEIASLLVAIPLDSRSVPTCSAPSSNNDTPGGAAGRPRGSSRQAPSRPRARAR